MKRGRLAIVVGLLVALSACGPKSAGPPSPSPSPSHESLVIASMPLKAGEVGLAYAGATFEATGGVQPYIFQITEGTLPDGLTLSRDGVLSGSPTTAGDFSFSIQVVDSGGQANSAQDSIDIVPALTLSALKTGTIYVESGCDTVCGGFASQTGGLAPYKYVVKSGRLPAGTSLSGPALAGKFSTTGNYSFTVEATDALGATATIAPNFSVFQHIYFFCPPNDWRDPNNRQNFIACNTPGQTPYIGALTFECGPHGADHPDCYNDMSFAGGTGTAPSVTYRIVQGAVADPTFDVQMGVTLGTYIGNVIYVTVYGKCSSAVLLVTIHDHALCGPGGAACTADAYLRIATGGC